MTDFTHHYKEISPLETVENVKKFFKEWGLKVELTDNSQSEAGTWFCHVDLYLGDTYIGGSNGKGMTEEYSLASGHAELYERFCNFDVIGNHYVQEEIKRQNLEAGNTYHYRSDEKPITYEELTNVPLIKKYLNRIAPNNEKLQKLCVDYWTNGDYTGSPFINIADPNDIHYVDSRAVIRVTHSLGMVAGNTFEEALNQGLSELCERENELCFYHNKWEHMHAIDLNNLQSEELKEKVKNIENLGYKFYIFDMSYETGLPGVMSLILDPENGTLNFNFGSFPVFEIAVERVITEIYQGVRSYRTNMKKSTVQQPYKLYAPEDLAMIYGNSITGEIFNASIFDKIIYEKTGSDVYIKDNNVSNSEINQYFCDLSKKTGINFYYRDNSFSNDIYALHLFFENPDTFLYYDEGWSVNTSAQKFDVAVMKNLRAMYQQIIEGNDTPRNLIMLNQQAMNPMFDNEFVGMNVMWNNFCISAGRGDAFFSLFQLVMNQQNQNMMGMVQQLIIPDTFMCTPIFKPVKKMVMIQRYVQTGLYTQEEIKHLFNDLYHFDVTDDDIKNCNDIEYVLRNVYCKPMIKYINSDEFKKFCSNYINR